ncbi:hypothetical protein NLJ89_g9172 [Agrocybe chaxingu]|uniref:F-box domain-containing protein n=1 Tax=Agrocybe chaxingu TaxID=84603 RepID=A0A9W8JRA6_9AGAR|nr:hypothetical protein NLJ89_g9172 [Agrocybe chaxingu]
MDPSPRKKLRTPSPAILPETSSIASPHQKGASHKLPDEILDYIFKIIINSEEDRILERPLMTLFRASSVCKRWRNFLHEPSIWGRVIDLDCMVQRKGNFRRLVMDRTRGASDLDVKGVIDDEDPLVLFLRTWTEPQHFNGYHWHRMRRLDLTIRDADRFDEVHALFATTPPHNLQSLRVIFQKYRYEESPLPIAFNTDIPSLLNLDTNVFYLPHRAANLSTLKSLSISFCNQSQVPYTLVDFADVLSQMIELESLDLCDAFRPSSQSPSLSSIYLPHLREMRITNDHECFALLEAINPHTACSINIHIIESLDDNIMVLRNVLSRYAAEFVRARIVNAVQIELSGFSIVVRLTAIPSDHRERALSFSFDAMLVSSVHTLAILLGAFDTCDLRRVTTLDLNLLTNMIRTRPTIPSPEIRHLISSLSGVQTLVTNMRTIKHLDGITTPQRIFPSLQTLKLTSLIISYGDERLINNDGNPARLRVDAKLLTDFLSIRTGTVHGLDLTQCALEDSVRFLDSPPFKDLKIMWKNNDGQRKVYTCGGGTPTCLDFGHRYE